jgi:hypothetical protein
MVRYLICTATDELNNGTEWKLPQDLKHIEDTESQKLAKQLKMEIKMEAKGAKEAATKEKKNAQSAAKKEAKDAKMAAAAINFKAKVAKMGLRRGAAKISRGLSGNTALPKANEPPPRGGGNKEITCELKIIRTMVNHEDRITWQGRIENSNGVCSLVAIKCYADRCSRDFEAACYDALSPLQGQSIPTLINRKVRPNGERRYGLVLSWVGEADNGNYMTLPTRILQRARELLEGMHKLGVAHGDARPENMNYNFKTDRLFIYDFSHARMRLAPDDAAFDRACAQDLENLDMEIKWSLTDEGRAIRYMP